MDCRELRGLADAYLDGELPRASRAEIDGHLAGCAACRAEIEASSAFIARLKAGASYFEAPAGLAARLAQRLASEPASEVVRLSPVSRRESFWRPMALAASFVLAALLSGGGRLYELAARQRRSHHPGGGG